jgi:predicted DNA-binding antitoxin AbrB/MazE fold protein
MTMLRTLTVIFDGEVFRPTEPVDFEPGRSYRVTIEDQAATESSTPEPGVLDDLLDFTIDTGIEDLAEQHDHYLYGTPKR